MLPLSFQKKIGAFHDKRFSKYPLFIKFFVSCIKMCKNVFLANLLGSQYLFEIMSPHVAVKDSENVVKS